MVTTLRLTVRGLAGTYLRRLTVSERAALLCAAAVGAGVGRAAV